VALLVCDCTGHFTQHVDELQELPSTTPFAVERIYPSIDGYHLDHGFKIRRIDR
jgi:hypothetical protein